MSKIVKTLFGDNGKGAAKAQGQQNEQDRQFIQQQTQQAQALLQQMYPVMQQNTMQYGQQALDTMRGALPQMAGVRQQGTQNAIAAILGGQGTQIQPNFDFLPQNCRNSKWVARHSNSRKALLIRSLLREWICKR